MEEAATIILCYDRYIPLSLHPLTTPYMLIYASPLSLPPQVFYNN